VLTLQDKLALAMTTAGSQRALASLIGITHQKLGRWLKEGQTGGAKKIPDDRETLKAINQAFNIHSQVSAEQARVDRIPFSKTSPVFAYRKPLKNGTLGDRVVIEHTQYLSRELRQKVLSHVQESKSYFAVSVRSTIELSIYFKQTEQELKHRIRTDSQDLARAELKGKIKEGVAVGPIFTKYESFGPKSSKAQALKGVEKKLREKHEAAVGQKGTALADQFLLQLIPANYYEPKASAKGKTTRARRKPASR
ncbi:MAG: hypothetical protein IPO08_23485, partial [Xanthomonadales bacterium]|nr:hypothetical protein [Xanthomonadales bacterium]